jgi:hypothetical protein
MRARGRRCRLGDPAQRGELRAATQRAHPRVSPADGGRYDSGNPKNQTQNAPQTGTRYSVRTEA